MAPSQSRKKNPPSGRPRNTMSTPLRILRERYHRIVQEGRQAEQQQKQTQTHTQTHNQSRKRGPGVRGGQIEALPNKPKPFAYGKWLAASIDQDHKKGFDRLMSDLQRDINAFQKRGETTNAKELEEVRNRYKGKLRRTRRRRS